MEGFNLPEGLSWTDLYYDLTEKVRNSEEVIYLEYPTGKISLSELKNRMLNENKFEE